MAKKKIGLYGGAFNPIHDGHIAVAKSAKFALELDEVWLLIDTSPRRKTGVVSYEHRVQMAYLAAEAHDYILIEPHKSIRAKTHDHTSMTELMEQYPDTEFCMIMGSDSYRYLPLWQNKEVFIRNCDFYVVSRDLDNEIAAKQVSQTLSRAGNDLEVHYAATCSPYSSTSIRQALIDGSKPRGINQKVLAYINRYNLYKTN